MSSTPIIIFGAAGFAALDAASQAGFSKILQANSVKDIDTANLYSGSEAALGKQGWPKDFTIHTKAPGFQPGCLKKQSVLDGMEKSLTNLGLSSVETYFLHSPDPDTPIEETLSTISELYEAGKFKHFGLSNFKPEQVQKIYDIQKSNGKVLPTVYQGNYNAAARHIESDLFPVLRKLKISFYAYSPIAGGFLVKSAQTLRDGTDGGRFAEGAPAAKLYNSLYRKESMLDALDEWEAIANGLGISKVALAYRWVTFNSALEASLGDGVILGASKASQLEESLAAFKDGPLDAETVKKIDGFWKKVEKDAPYDNYSVFIKQ
ncbi:hypothetical protein BP5796_06458 [Coleophoma crateriformis]|uniref:NADP-dependent oxidoreductase domain-containing protein n=1 Tax=Coleophoma crateriformis TaxID=565419 RepID=A0A3D8RNJ4_9HELO|nr:hypothetical protein BP5796_06458 [Coleophoma crateriformis]